MQLSGHTRERERERDACTVWHALYGIYGMDSIIQEKTISTIRPDSCINSKHMMIQIPLDMSMLNEMGSPALVTG